MKPRIYFAIDPSNSAHQIAWIDPAGNKHRDVLEPPPGARWDLADFGAEFKIMHPGAIQISTDELVKLWEKIQDEKAKLNAWKLGLPIL